MGEMELVEKIGKFMVQVDWVVLLFGLAMGCERVMVLVEDS